MATPAGADPGEPAPDVAVRPTVADDPRPPDAADPDAADPDAADPDAAGPDAAGPDARPHDAADGDPRPRRRWRRNAFVQIVTCTIAALAFFAGLSLVLGSVPYSIVTLAPLAAAGIAVTYTGYVFGLVRWMEGRSTVQELRLRGSLRLWLAGLGLGAGLLVLVVGAVAVLGDVEIAPGRRPALVAAGVVWGAVHAAFVEELAFRGVLFRITERALGTWAALGISAIMFGGAHVFNPNATLWSTIALMVEAGVLFGALYVLTRRLWICVGCHLGWNLMLCLLGLPNSGNLEPGIRTVRLHGPDLLTGGAFGPEASLVTALLLTGTSVAVLWHARRRGRWVTRARRRGPGSQPVPGW